MRTEDVRRLFKCSVCGKPCERGCGCTARIIRDYIDASLAERVAEARELSQFAEMARRGVL